jgi:hypothetical protein
MIYSFVGQLSRLEPTYNWRFLKVGKVGLPPLFL